MLGQSTVKMSQRYTHGVIETMQGAVEKLCDEESSVFPHLSPQEEKDGEESIAA
jgi:hypothetical protein